MIKPSRRKVLALRIGVAHIVGLLFVGFYGTIGTSGRFGLGAFLDSFMGAIFSLPWIAAVFALVWFKAGALDRHITPFCVIGPIIVCGSWWVIDGLRLLDAVVLSCVTSSAFVLITTALERSKSSQVDIRNGR